MLAEGRERPEAGELIRAEARRVELGQRCEEKGADLISRRRQPAIGSGEGWGVPGALIVSSGLAPILVN